MRAHSEEQAVDRIFPLHNFSAVRTAYDESLAQSMHLLVCSTSLAAAVSGVQRHQGDAPHLSRLPKTLYGHR
jgi:hypothetical protein